MGLEGFSGGDIGPEVGNIGPEVGKAEAGQLEASSVIIRASVDVCSQRGNAWHPCICISPQIPPAYASEPAFRCKIPNVPPSRFHGIDASEDLKLGYVNASQSLITGPEAKQLNRRSEKISRRNSGRSKRSRIVRLELPINKSAVEETKGNSSEKTQMPKQRNNSNGKQGDKRNGRVPKSRTDSFCLKNGLVSFSPVAGGGNFLVYGSKSEIFDVRKPVDELPLNELLDGSYSCPSLVKDKGKAVENSNENLLHSVRKACSLLRLQSSLHAQNSAEIDNSCNQKFSTGQFSTCASPTSRMDGGKDSCPESLPASSKDSCGYVKTPAVIGDSPLCPPKDMLERLALPPFKDLDSLLLDAVKPASCSRNTTDLRLGKTVSHPTGLPPFPRSHNSSGHSKSGPDSVKLSASKTTCPGRWIRVGNTLTPLKGSNSLLVDLKSLTYNHRIVPLGNLESASLGVESASSTCVNFTSSEQVLLSSATCSASRAPPAEYSPKLLAAAQTLCEIASHSLKQNSHEMMKWLKEPSQKTMKACKLKLGQKSEELFVAPKASMGPHNLVKVAYGLFPSKKLRLSEDEKIDAVCHTNPARKGPKNWSAPRSIRSSPSKLFRDSVREMKNYKNFIVKKPYMMPPPTRVTTDKACNSRQKLKKIMPMEWSPAAKNPNR